MIVLIAVLNFTLVFLFIQNNDLSLLISLFLFYLISLSTNLIISTKKEFLDLSRVIFLVLPAYIIYAFVCYSDVYEFVDLFYSDEEYFYQTINQLTRESSVQSIWEITLVQRVHRDYEGYFLLHGVIGHVFEKYFSGNSILLQSCWSAFLGVLSNLFVYKILRNFFSQKKSFWLVLLFAYCSPLFYYTPWLLRDIHICFLYALAFYFVLKKVSVFNLGALVVIGLVASEIRIENGLFLLAFPFVNILINRKKQKNIRKAFPFVLIVFVLALVFIINLNLQALSNSLVAMNSYAEFTENRLGSGFASVLYRLPFGIKHIAVAINSQFTPMPPWALFLFEDSFFIASLVKLINTSFWSIMTIFGMICLFKTKIPQLPISVKYLLFLTVVFLLLNTNNLTVRRIIGVYPILFLTVALIASNLRKPELKKYINYSVISYVGLNVVYFIMKGIL